MRTGWLTLVTVVVSVSRSALVDSVTISFLT